MKIGDRYEVRRRFSQQDFNRFAVLSKDDNPIHVDPEFAKTTHFGATVAHGMFLYSNLLGILHTEFPGAGSVQLEQELMFPNPTFVGDVVCFQLEVTAIDANEVTLATQGLKDENVLVFQGQTRVRLPQ
jgi:acyl dehydratase